MQKYQILWVDDEIELLKPHILFLEQKGCRITPTNSGVDALDFVKEHFYDMIFLDENMPGMTGLETLQKIKLIRPHVPVVMITKSEEEYIMEEAIGAKIADYLIKPLNPSQILLSIKRILDNKKLVTEKTNLGYQQDFRSISTAYNDFISFDDWVDIYKKLIYWEMEIEHTTQRSMYEVLEMQKSEANANFSKFIQENYKSWLNDAEVEKPVLSHQIMKKKVFPILDNIPTYFILIDNLRFDQWKTIRPIIADYYYVNEESSYYSILPTTTAYARNSIFSGMLPSEMSKYHSDIWVSEDEEEGKNNQEEEFLKRQIKKNQLDIRFSYHKILTHAQGKALVDSVLNLQNNNLNALVFNFVDMLSHARTDMAMIKELAPDEAAYRSLTRSWFLHSTLLELLKRLAEMECRVIITTDHGTIRVNRPCKIIGDRNVNTNLRYKQGRNLSLDEEKIFWVKNPKEIHLPTLNLSTTYVFATDNFFFAYPNNFNYYANYYKDTFQHGGISLEEMIIPLIVMEPR